MPVQTKVTLSNYVPDTRQETKEFLLSLLKGMGLH